MPYTVYAISNHGQDYLQTLGTYDSLEEIKIRVGAFARDVVIEIEEEEQEEIQSVD